MLPRPALMPVLIVCVCARGLKCACAHHKRASHILELELQALLCSQAPAPEGAPSAKPSLQPLLAQICFQNSPKRTRKPLSRFPELLGCPGPQVLPACLPALLFGFCVYYCIYLSVCFCAGERGGQSRTLGVFAFCLFALC